LSERTLLRWWRAPLWLVQLATGAKSFADNPILGSETLNRRGLHVARLKLAHSLAWARRRRLAPRVPSEWREQFDRDGFVEVRDFLPQDVFARLQETLLTTEFDSRQQQQGDAITRRVPIGPALVAAVPELRELLRSKPWRSLLAYVASTRAEPLYYLQTILAGQAAGGPDPQLELHADTFHPSLKAWLFLTDVTDDQAPLTYVPGSHRLTPERIAWERARSVAIAGSDRLSQRGSLRIAREELANLKLPEPKRFAVPANTLVVIDTYLSWMETLASPPDAFLRAVGEDAVTLREQGLKAIPSLRMLASVQFDHESRLAAGKIGDIGPEWHLFAPVLIRQRGTQRIPKQAFCLGHFAAEAARALDCSSRKAEPLKALPLVGRVGRGRVVCLGR